MTTLPLLFLAALASAQMTAPSAPPSVSQLHDAFVEATDDAQKTEATNALAKTAPSTPQDLRNLFDLFVRYPDVPLRNAAISSLSLANPHSPQLEPLILNYIQEPDPETELFAIKAALRMRPAKALPYVEKIARRPFGAKHSTDRPILSERNAWWTQYEALAALAQWRGASALPLLVKKADEAPAAARIMALYLWKESFPQLVKWASSAKSSNKEKAAEGLKAAVPREALRETRAAMLKIMRDPKADWELRHQLALKVGVSSTEEEIAELLKEHDALTDGGSQLMFSVAVFASRSKQAVPLLTKFAKENAAAPLRAGALVQLKELMPPADYKALLEWVVKNDPDPENKQNAAAQLK